MRDLFDGDPLFAGSMYVPFPFQLDTGPPELLPHQT